MLKNVKPGILSIFVIVLLLKIWTCFTMGHFDIYRFLIFFQHAISNPGVNPWEYKTININSDFPYPPFLFYFFRGLLSLFPSLISSNPPYEPVGLLYSVIKMPIFIFDMVLMYLFVKRWGFAKAVLFYWTSGVVLFHQYYSGQFDIIVVALFFMGVLFEETKGRSWFYFFLLLSVVLKPFAVIFFVPILLNKAKNSREFLIVSTILLGIFVVFKLSEFPYIQSSDYRTQMGAGAHALMNTAFILSYALFCLFLFYERNKGGFLPVPISVFIVMLFVGAFTNHSAGWMMWAAGAAPFVFTKIADRKLNFAYVVWNLLFIVMWVFCPTSPVADSFSVFTDKFLGLDLNLKMGLVYAHVPKIFIFDSFKFFSVLFSIASLTVLMLTFNQLKQSKNWSNNNDCI